VLWLALCFAPAWSATLERLSLDDMIAKSTAIVRVQVIGSSAVERGSLIYTDYQVHVIDRWKGAPQTTVNVSVPGGILKGVRQSYAGAPEFTPGEQYVLFLWTSSKGVTYTLGFTQGVFHLPKDAFGRTVAVRGPTTETLLEPGTGRALKDEPMRMPLAELVSLIRSGAQR
jgi:hypothetical protein